jgi:membrane-associated protease RseP (regulator of RpoE activity)
VIVWLKHPSMNPKAIGRLAALLLVSGKAHANAQPAPCSVYFNVIENDEVTLHLPIFEMNEPQNIWYENYGNREQYSGICYVENASRAPAGAPLYAIVWGVHLANAPYLYSSQLTEPPDEHSTITSENANTNTVSSAGANVPISHATSGAKQSYVVDGWLTVRDSKTNQGKGTFVAVGPLRTDSHSLVALASALLMNDAMEQISQREKGRLITVAHKKEPHKNLKASSLYAKNGWSEIIVTPMKNEQPAPIQTSPSTRQTSSDAAPPSTPFVIPPSVPATLPNPSKSSPVNASLTVRSVPSGAKILLDDDFVGSTPSTIDVPPGKHIITIKKSEFQEWLRTMNFSGGSITLDAELLPKPSEMLATHLLAKPDPTRESAGARPATDTLEKPVAWIGISAKNHSRGVLVTKVSAKGPAALAGIHIGDIILGVNGPLSKSKDFYTAVAALKPGTRVPIEFLRGSSTHEVWITVPSQN